MLHLALAVALLLAAPSAPTAPGDQAVGPSGASAPSGRSGPADATPVRIDALVAPGRSGLDLSPTALSLAGRRVRLVGFMAHLEQPGAGTFWLTSRPVECDEGGAGTGDLPPDAVLVVAPSAAGRAITFLPGPLEVSGVLQVGQSDDGDGRTSSLRLILDRADHAAGPASAGATP